MWGTVYFFFIMGLNVVIPLYCLTPSRFYPERFRAFLFTGKIYYWSLLFSIYIYYYTVGIILDNRFSVFGNIMWEMFIGFLSVFIPLWFLSISALYLIKRKLNNRFVYWLVFCILLSACVWAQTYFIEVSCAGPKSSCYI